MKSLHFSMAQGVQREDCELPGCPDSWSKCVKLTTLVITSSFRHQNDSRLPEDGQRHVLTNF